ncbi:ECF RNA polymerase sigma factor SigJ [compost metagenome]
MLVLLERLSPAERAVFVLREALCFEYSDMAELVGKSEANCRKLISRARAKMGFTLDQPVPAEEAGGEWVNRFLSALEQGHVQSLLSLLSEDVVLLSDGGGKVLAVRHPIKTRERVAQFLFALIRTTFQDAMDFRVELMPLNGQTSFVIYKGDLIESICFLHIEQEAIRGIYLVRNPDKLNLKLQI